MGAKKKLWGYREIMAVKMVFVRLGGKNRFGGNYVPDIKSSEKRQMQQ